MVLLYPPDAQRVAKSQTKWLWAVLSCLLGSLERSKDLAIRMNKQAARCGPRRVLFDPTYAAVRVVTAR